VISLKEHQDFQNINREIDSPFRSGDYISRKHNSDNDATTQARPISSPFAESYTWPGFEGKINEKEFEISRFTASLYDDEFDAAVFQIMEEASELIADYGEHQEVTVQHLLNDHFVLLVSETEAAMDVIAEHIDELESETISESEFENIINEWRQNRQSLTPAQDYFLGRWVKKAAKWAKKKVKSVGKWAIRKALSKLKKMVNPVLNMVLQKGINRLPVALRPIAKKYAKKILKRVSEAELENSGYEGFSDVSLTQHEIDLHLTRLLYAEDDEREEAVLSEFLSESSHGTENTIANLQSARERFIQEVIELEDEDDVEPAVERFIPALLPALKLGLKLAGRPRVVNFIAKYVARFIKKFVGRKYAKPLSRSIVDAGLRLIHLETTESDELEAASSAAVGIVEDTVREAAGLPEYVLEDEILLEGFLLDSFEKAAAANLPQLLAPSAYEERPELRETTRHNGAWVMLPRGRKKRFKKFTKVIDVTITPHAAAMIKAHGLRPLAKYFQEKLGLPAGKNVKARVHLYEAMLGTRPSDIRRYDPGVTSHLPPGQENEHFHPLTQEAAAALLGEPGLGKEYREEYHSDRLGSGSGGERIYFLETEDVPFLASQKNFPRMSDARLTLDFHESKIKLFIFINEGRAQEIARKMRRQEPAGLILSRLIALINVLLQEALSCKVHHHARVLHEALNPQAMIGSGLKRIPGAMLKELPDVLTSWLGQSLKELVTDQVQDFISATEDAADGVTLSIEIIDPPGFSNLRKMVTGNRSQIDSVNFKGRAQAYIRIISGFYNE